MKKGIAGDFSSEEAIGICTRLLSTKKYRDLELPKEIVLDLIFQAAKNSGNARDIEKIVRQKLHNIVAPYLESVDYKVLAEKIKEIKSTQAIAIEDFSLMMLSSHASTRERLPIMTDFFARIFSLTGTPKSVVDLACGFNPFALPWMKLPGSTIYHAYDVHQPRVDLINDYLTLLGRTPLAEKRDILVDPPKEYADVAFFFKEAHRFEQRQHGCNRAFWQALNVRFLIVSLPSANLSGSRSMLEGQRILVKQAIEGLSWTVEELLFETEIAFCIDKGL